MSMHGFGQISYLLYVFLLHFIDQCIDGSKVEVVLAKPVDKNDYRIYARGKSALQQVIMGDNSIFSQLSSVVHMYFDISSKVYHAFLF